MRFLVKALLAILLCAAQCSATRIRSSVRNGLAPLENTVGSSIPERDTILLDADQEEDIRRTLVGAQANSLFEIGCYEEPAQAEVTVKLLDDDEEIEDCTQKCAGTPFFAIRPSDKKRCLCIPRVGRALVRNGRTTRKDFGDCEATFPSTGGLVDVYFRALDRPPTDNCASAAVRSFLTAEGNAPPGVDFFAGELRDTPFFLYASGCGTNMWNVQTTVSGSISDLRQSTRSTREFALDKKEKQSAAIDTSFSVGIPLVASAKASLSASVEIERAVSRGGNSLVETKVIESSAQSFLASIKIPRDAKHFVTLQGSGSSGFLGRLVSYFFAGLPENMGLAILQDFGQFVVTEAAYGGYFQSRSEFTRAQQAKFALSDEQFEACFEQTAEASGIFKGVNLGGSGSVAGCTNEAQRQLSRSSEENVREVGTQFFVGGTVVNGEFIVTPETSQLLIKPELYQGRGVQFKLGLLADFLTKDRISPVTCARAKLTEDQFHTIHLALRKLTIRLLETVGKKFESCGCNPEFGVPVLAEFELKGKLSDSRIRCICKEPLESFILCSKRKGILSGPGNGAVCCPASCGLCGGSGCSSRPGGGNCCSGNILRRPNNLCTTKPAPCKFKELTPQQLCTLNSGIMSASGKVCCPKSCGVCGGSGCSGRPGGGNCCEGNLLRKSNNLCTSKGAPCKFKELTPSQLCTLNRGILSPSGTVCCHSTCKSCSESFICGIRKDAQLCCAARIKRTADVCTVKSAPCSMVGTGLPGT